MQENVDAKGISVVIPAFNCERFISDAISSALSQTREAVEVIVVDDGSTDDTKVRVDEFGSRLKYLRQPNLGVCAARNLGVGASAGKYIAFLDADDIWEPTKLAKQLAIFESDREIGLVHTGMREFDSDTSGTIRLLIDGQDGWLADQLLLWDGPAVNVSGSSIMVTRAAFDEVGGFDTRQKVGEDWDFCYRVARKYKVGFVPEPVVNYRSHAAAAHHNVSEMEKGMSLFYEKAFADGDEHVLSLRSRALGNFHKVLSGSYFSSGDYPRFLAHAVRSIRYRPANIGYFLKFPVRRLRGMG